MKKETSATRLRRNPEYYANELRENAKRNKLKNYYKREPNRKVVISELRKKYQAQTGAGRKARRWTQEEIDYLEENYKELSGLEMALALERSWVSIHHKLERLGLRVYNKYNIIKLRR